MSDYKVRDRLYAALRETVVRVMKETGVADYKGAFVEEALAGNGVRVGVSVELPPEPKSGGEGAR